MAANKDTKARVSGYLDLGEPSLCVISNNAKQAVQQKELTAFLADSRLALSRGKSLVIVRISTTDDLNGR